MLPPRQSTIFLGYPAFTGLGQRPDRVRFLQHEPRMAHASRSSAGLSDDPIENATAWLALNQKPILTAVGVIALGAVAIFGYRYMDGNKRSRANRDLYLATAPMTEGRMDAAEVELAKVVQKYSGTGPGTQAALLLAQVKYEGKKYGEAIALLEKAKGSAGNEFASSIEALIATGFEAQGKFVEAAEHFGKAASASKFALDKAANQASQARSLTAAGKPEDARKIWEVLVTQEDTPYAQEARVRLGELIGIAK